MDKTRTGWQTSPCPKPVTDPPKNFRQTSDYSSVDQGLADQQISTADLERAEACSDQIIVLREDFDPVLIVDAERARATVVEHQKILELIRTKVSRPEIEQTARHHVLASPQARTEVQSELLKTENV